MSGQGTQRTTGPEMLWQEGRPRRWGRATRHVRTAITMILMLAFVGAAAVYGWRELTRPPTVGSRGPLVGSVCAPNAGDPEPANEQIELNIFNGTTRNGLAARAAKDLRARGFVILEIANANTADFQTGVAQVRASIDAQAEAAVVLAMLPGATFRPDNRQERSLDIIFGTKFKKLAKAGSAYKPPKNVEPCTALPTDEVT